MFKERKLVFIEGMCTGAELDTFKPIILFIFQNSPEA